MRRQDAPSSPGTLSAGTGQGLQQITPVLLTYNEMDNIGRTLAGLAWAQRIVVVDSGSTDGTLDLLAADPRITVVVRPFDSFGPQWNSGLERVETPWVLSLDADYGVTRSLAAALAAALEGAAADGTLVNGHVGFRIPFRYCVHGKPLRCAVLPARIALFRLDRAHFEDDGHKEHLVLDGPCGQLDEPLLHDDRKPLSRWLWSQQRYASQEVDKLRQTPTSQLSFADRLRRRHVIAPLALPFICLVLRGGVLDGWRGWFYAFQRAYAELLLSLMLWEERATAGP